MSAKVTKECQLCSKVFIRYQSFRQNFCSRKCVAVSKKGKPNPKTGSKLKKTWIKKNCSTCSKEYEVTPCRKKQAKYCSQKCRPAWNKGKKGFMCGDKHYNWRGGVTTLNEYQRQLFKKNIQKEVLKRDGYTCQMCNKKNEYLHVDHIQPFSEYIELRFSMDNCRTLCRSCHYLVTYGKEMPKDSVWGKGGKSYRI